MPKFLRSFVVVGALALSAGPASAGQQAPTVTVTATIAPSCKALTPQTLILTFPAYDAFSNKTTADDAPGGATFTTQCTAGASNVYYTVSGGNNCVNSPIAGTRAMKSGTNYLAYRLFQDAARSTEWGINPTTCDGTTHLSSGTITSSSQTLSFSVYGSIPAGQDPRVAGDYSDSISVAVNF